MKIFLEYTKLITLLFFPPYCFICKKGNDRDALCKECLSLLSPAITTPSPFITNIYSFKDPRIKKIIHAIKYYHRKDLIIPLAKKLAQEITFMEKYESYTLIPIPMPALRKYVRGHNHSEVLAKCISEEISLPITNSTLLRNPLVSKKRQAIISSRKERFQNQKNVFVVAGSVAGMNIILIDDVTTTGATLSEARRALLAHGASSVCAYTIAH